MEYEDLPSDAQEVFDQAESDFEGSVDDAVRQKYVDGLQRAVDNNTFAEGLARKFNMDASDFSGLSDKWESNVQNADADDWEEALTAAGVPQKFKENLVIGLTETEG
ncbi:MAG: hypothetical protein J07AB43_02990 [Candidatus Nanosalina sp. J07AB43]|jgi:hypothetical protein|nr:MAG: hypothetical protein J07AB43_02990 [Candidatus Nanosalina sp. J07AB43]